MSEPTIDFPALPISSHVDEIVGLLREHPVIVVAGETGSGKTTQLPKMCLLAGRQSIGHTQPRRIAARSVAERIAEETGTNLGQLVGYQVRFTRQTGADTRIKLMTDGILLNEITHDRDLRKYDTIIIDEAHERSLNIDFLLGYLKQLLARRDDLKVIITSATIDTARFSKHFGDAPIVEVSGRGYPVEIRYRPLARDGQEIEQSEGIVEAVRELIGVGRGDILVFCSGEREIRDAQDAIDDAITAKRLAPMEVLPLHSGLSAVEQHRIFQSHRGRRIVISTNIAETSLTVPGIRYVIDAGTARISRYSVRTKVQRLPIEPISQASANQRAGRCGRVAPGVAIRLYSEEDFAARDEFTEPEILRTNLASVILQMAKARLGDIEDFPFVEAPDSSQIADGVRLLDELGALAKRKPTRLTRVGHALAELPIDPKLGRMLIEAARRDCLKEVLIVVSFLGIQDIRERPAEQREQADQFHARFFSDAAMDQPLAGDKKQKEHVDYGQAKAGEPLRFTVHTSKTERARAMNAKKVKAKAQPGGDSGGDIIAILRMWGYLKVKRRELSGNQFRKLCRNEFLNFMRTREWQDLHTQLGQICKSLRMKKNDKPASYDKVIISALSGLLGNIGFQLPRPEKPKTGKRLRRPLTEFQGARGAKFAIQPGSALAKNPPQLVVAVELVETSRLWARTVEEIQPEWVEQIGGHLLKRNYTEPHFAASRNNVVARERATLLGVPIIADRLVNFGRIDPAEARKIFIQTGIVEGEWRPDDRHANHDFLRHNLAVLAEADEIVDRTRGSGIFVDDRDIFEFYDVRLPSDVNSQSTFDKWWKKYPDKTFLEFDIDLFAEEEDIASAREQFPDRWQFGDLNLPVSYEFAPGAGRDGVSVKMPLAQLNQISPEPFSWQVPGLRLELATELIRHLPKQVRTQFVPAPDHARAALTWLEENGADRTKRFCDELGRALFALNGVAVDSNDWNPFKVPDHLQVGFEVTRPGRDAVYSNDLGELRKDLAVQVAKTINKVAPKSQKSDSWTFGDIPQTKKVKRSGITAIGYPALRDFGSNVGQVLEETEERQRATHSRGVRRLLQLVNPDPTRWAVSRMRNDQKLALPSSPYDSMQDLLTDAWLKAAGQAAEAHGGLLVWNEKDFDRLALEVRQDQADQMVRVVDVAAKVCELAAQVRVQAAESPIGDEILQQLQDLYFPGFISFIRDPWYRQLPKYLQAMLSRMSSYTVNPNRDVQNSNVIYSLLDEYDALCDRLPAGPIPDEVDDIAFMIEELRVQFFAQQLGTAVPVSAKRIRNKISQIF